MIDLITLKLTTFVHVKIQKEGPKHKTPFGTNICYTYNIAATNIHLLQLGGGKN